MIQGIMKNPAFNIAFSFLLGVGIIAIIRPKCKSTGKDGECASEKAPPVKDWDGAVYRVGNKCFEYKSNIVDCPKNKDQYIESFQSQFNNRESRLSAN